MEKIIVNKHWDLNIANFKIIESSLFKEMINQMPTVYGHVNLPISTIYLFDLQDLSLLKKSNTWIARDGVVGLLWFFEKNEIPPQAFSTNILIDERLSCLVPLKWRKWFKPFKIFSEELKTIKSTKLLIHQTGYYFKNENGFKKLEQKSKEIRKIEIQEIYFANGAMARQDLEFVTDLIKFSQKNILKKFEYVPLESREKTEMHTGMNFFEINNLFFSSLSGISLNYLLKGARDLNSQKKRKSEELIYLSDKNGLAISKSFNDNQKINCFGERALYMKKYYEKKYPINVFTNNYPWSLWFQEWARTVWLEIKN